RYQNHERQLDSGIEGLQRFAPDTHSGAINAGTEDDQTNAKPDQPRSLACNPLIEQVRVGTEKQIGRACAQIRKKIARGCVRVHPPYGLQFWLIVLPVPLWQVHSTNHSNGKGKTSSGPGRMCLTSPQLAAKQSSFGPLLE